MFTHTVTCSGSSLHRLASRWSSIPSSLESSSRCCTVAALESNGTPSLTMKPFASCDEFLQNRLNDRFVDRLRHQYRYVVSRALPHTYSILTGPRRSIDWVTQQSCCKPLGRSSYCVDPQRIQHADFHICTHFLHASLYSRLMAIRPSYSPTISSTVPSPWSPQSVSSRCTPSPFDTHAYYRTLQFTPTPS